MALLQITIIPMGTGTSMGDFLVPVHKLLTDSGLKFQLNDMGTLIEGTITELLAITAEINEIPFKLGATRVVSQITIDDRRDRNVSIGDKIHAVNQRLQQQ